MMIHISMLPPRGTFDNTDVDMQQNNNCYEYKVNYRVFNIEALLELRLNLIEFLSSI